MSDADPACFVVTRRARGRPRAPVRSEPVSSRVPTPVYDRLVRRALAQDMTVAALVRSLLLVSIAPDRPPR